MKISERRGRVVVTLLASLLFMLLSFWCKFPTLYEWDSVNYVLGSRTFNLFLIQPQPPGYLGFVMVLKGFIFLFNSDFYGFYFLVLLSYIIFALFSTLMAGELIGTFFNPAVYLLFLSVPMVFFHSTVTTIYLTEGTTVVVLTFILLKILQKRLHPFFASFVLLGALVKPNIPFMLLPLTVYVLWRRCGKKGQRLLAVSLMALAVFAGVLGLQKLVFWISQAPDSLDRLVSSYILRENILSAYFGGFKNLILTVVKNFKNVFLALIIQLFALFMVMMPGSGKMGLFRNLSREYRNFLLLWILPQLSFVLFFYFPKNGYLLEILTGILILFMGCIPLSSLQKRMKWVWMVNLIIFFVPLNIDYLKAKVRVSGADKTVNEYMLSQVVRMFETTHSHLRSIRRVNEFYFTEIRKTGDSGGKLFILDNSVADHRVIPYYLKKYTFLIVQKERQHFMVSFFRGGVTRIELVKKRTPRMKLDGFDRYYLISSTPDTYPENLKKIENTIYRICDDSIRIKGLRLELPACGPVK